MLHHFARSLRLAVLGAGALALPAAAQSSATPSRTIAIFPVQLDFSNANAVFGADSALGTVASDTLRAAMERAGAYRLADSRALDDTLRAMRERSEPCVGDPCALRLARAIGADVALTTRLSKISTPVWYLDAHLLDVATGKTLTSEEFELKGRAPQMVPKGMEVVARRVSAAAASHP